MNYTVKVREYRLEQNKTLKELSRLSGISVAHISNIELGNKIPSVCVAFILSKALKKNICEVFHCIN